MNRAASVLFFVVLASLPSCREAPPPPPPKETPPSSTVELSPEGFATAQIITKKIVPGTFVPRMRLAGAITGDPKHVAQIGARVSGRVTGVLVALGDVVKRGQDLVAVDAVELHQVVLEYRTAMAKERAARDALARQQQLVDERVGAVQDLRRAESTAAAASAELTESREHLKFLGLSDREVANMGSEGNAAKSRIKSPIAGRVASLAVTLGQVLTGNETVAVVADLDAIWAEVRVYERDLGDARVGTEASVQVPAYPQRTFDGKVAFVSDILDPSSRSAEVRVSLLNPDGALRPGMSATALVPRTNVTGLWIPVTAAQPRNGQSVVFVRTGDRRFEARPVVVGSEEGGFVPILKGVSADDDVVVEGAFALRGELERSTLQGD